MDQHGTHIKFDVTATIPAPLRRLEELANDLWYSWDRPTRWLFARLHRALWEATGQSPKAFLRQVDEALLVRAAADSVFLSKFHGVLSAYDTYLAQPDRSNHSDHLSDDEVVAYFCAEFGFHESLPIYSGGLGILAADHCKAASDAALPFVGVGLLYRQGYFFQTIDGDGNQRAAYQDSEFEALPVTPVLDGKGYELHVGVEMPSRTVEVKVWQARVGHVKLYLLDTDLAENSEGDRAITHRLYGGDRVTRIEQEIVLGVGGVRALDALGIRPAVWHINEGHAAFLVLERARLLVRQGIGFAVALEVVAANTVFTTHTAVSAGHDYFTNETMLRYFESYCRDVELDPAALLALGQTTPSSDFNMTALAVRGSRHHNGVSRIHGAVSARILAELWPQIPADENPINYITNGVHLKTFLAPEWQDVFDRFLSVDWPKRLTDSDYWTQVEAIPDDLFWSVREFLKLQMIEIVRQRIHAQLMRNRKSEAHLDRLLRLADPKRHVLTIGFGRRFATYKRSTLLFQDLDALRRLVSDPERPVLFVFAGKAHPADVPGQDLIREIIRVAKLREFEGRILMVEGYDLRLARRLVAGVDVWLNNPIYPLEASGTSGMKAAINGVLNLSVMDGWWDEGYDGTNGWEIKPAGDDLEQSKRDQDEARALYELLEDRVIPLYYQRDGLGYSPGWVRMAKRAMVTILPRFNSARMLNEYVTKSYLPAARQGHCYQKTNFATATQIAQWKERIRAAWPRVGMRRLDQAPSRVRFGERLRLEVAVQLNGLGQRDIVVELVCSRPPQGDGDPQMPGMRFVPEGSLAATGEQNYVLDFAPAVCGKLDYRIRAFPSHALLTHPFELGLMVWL